MKDEHALDTVSIAHARFQSASQSPLIDPDERRELRMEHRETLLPPGLIRPRWAVSDTFRYCYGDRYSEEEYVVPAGYPFDGASVPWPLTLLVPKTHSLYIGAAALHDFLYECKHDQITRRHADDVFREAMLVLGLNWVWAGLMWRAVRAAGWTVWYKRKPNSVVGRFLNLHWAISMPIGWVITILRGLFSVIFVDLFSLKRYRRLADAVADKDD